MRYFALSPALAVALLLRLAGPGRAQTPASLPPPGRDTLRQVVPVLAAAAGCAHPFGLRPGQNVEYQLLDARGRATGSWRFRVMSTRTDTAGKKNKRVVTTKVQLKSGLYDLTNRVLQQQDLTIACRRDTTYTDGLAEINYEGLKSFRDRLMAYRGTPLAWPNSPAAGTRLPDGGATVQVSSPSVAIAQVNTRLRQRRVLAGPAPVTVPAGTFRCYAVESVRELATAARADLVLKSSGRQVDYYDPAAGIVKTEFYDKAGKLTQTRVLAKH